MTNSRDHWATPRWVVDAIRDELGRDPWIDLCASPKNRKAGKIIDEETDLLSVDPRDLVPTDHRDWAWMNPPFSRMREFTDWARRYAEAGGKVCVLHRADFGTRWWQSNMRDHVGSVFVPDRRIRFIPPEGVKSSSPSFTSVVSMLVPYPIWPTEMFFISKD